MPSADRSLAGWSGPPPRLDCLYGLPRVFVPPGDMAALPKTLPFVSGRNKCPAEADYGFEAPIAPAELEVALGIWTEG